jgi:hypothetical protein
MDKRWWRISRACSITCESSRHISSAIPWERRSRGTCLSPLPSASAA